MIFVFGSNELGIHGAGAARFARESCGAVYGQGWGLQGSSFAIPTCATPTGRPDCGIPIEKVREYVERFIVFARENSDLEFQITQIGCGFAGWTSEQIAPMFDGAPDNCSFDEAWKPWLGDRKYWGTH